MRTKPMSRIGESIRRWTGFDYPAEAAREVRREQLHALASASSIFAMIGLSSGFLLAWTFRHQLSAIAVLLIGGIEILYLAWLNATRQWRRGLDGDAFLRVCHCLILGLAITWGALFNILAAEATGNQKSLILSFVIACVSTPILAAPISAALAFWVPAAVTAIYLISFGIPPFDPHLLISFLGFLSFTLTAILQLNRSLIQRCTTNVQLRHQKQIVELLLRDFEEDVEEWIWETDPTLRLTRVSSRLARLAQQPTEALVGAQLQRLPLFKPGATPTLRKLRRAIHDRRAFRDVELEVQVEGETRWWCVTGRPLFDEAARYLGYRGIGTDVTEERRAEQRIAYLACHDSLTGLVNRGQFTEDLEKACRETSCPVALLFLDLDRFKVVNDTLGHAAGDDLLVAVAERLRSSLRGSSVIARFGGDEFAALVDAENEEEACTIAQRILLQLSQPFVLQGARVDIGASIGIAMASGPLIDGKEMLKRADLAVYRAKSDGRGVFRVFDPDMDIEQRQLLSLQSDLRRAFEWEELHLEFQPIIDLVGYRVVAFEALARWTHRSLGPIAPSMFIQMAEDTGLIGKLGRWVLEQACHEATKWPDQLRVAVNVSPLQLRAPNFLEMVDRALDRSGLAPDRLELEITESALLRPDDKAITLIRTIRDMGVRFVLDDFGRGFSSLTYLTQFRFDGLKIDAAFVHAAMDNSNAAAIVKSIGSLGEDLGVNITGEGVEDIGHLRCLQNYRIGQAQGFLFGHPMGAAELPWYLNGVGHPDILRAKASLGVAEAASA